VSRAEQTKNYTLPTISGMTVSEYHQRAQECMDMALVARGKTRKALLQIAHAWLLLAEAALAEEEPVQAAHNADVTTHLH
jgi:hypothetical protein